MSTCIYCIDYLDYSRETVIKYLDDKGINDYRETDDEIIVDIFNLSIHFNHKSNELYIIG